MLCHICEKDNPMMNLLGGGKCDNNKVTVTLENGYTMSKHGYNGGIQNHCCTTCKYCNKEKTHKKCYSCREIDAEASDYNFTPSRIKE